MIRVKLCLVVCIVISLILSFSLNGETVSNSYTSNQQSIAVEIVRGLYSGLLFSTATALGGSLLSAVMVQNWERTSVEDGIMFGMPIGMIYGSSYGVVGWENTNSMQLFAARIGAITPVIFGGLLGSLVVENPKKGIRNGVFTGQFLVPFTSALAYNLYKLVVFPEQASVKSNPLHKLPSNLTPSDEQQEEDFIFQLVEIKF